MTVYLVADVDVTDPEVYAEYVARVPALIERHGGSYIVRAGAHEVLEGDWQPGRLVIFGFPDAAHAHAFVDDPDYLEIKAIRTRASTANIVLVEGV